VPATRSFPAIAPARAKCSTCAATRARGCACSAPLQSPADTPRRAPSAAELRQFGHSAGIPTSSAVSSDQLGGTALLFGEGSMRKNPADEHGSDISAYPGVEKDGAGRRIGAGGPPLTTGLVQTADDIVGAPQGEAPGGGTAKAPAPDDGMPARGTVAPL